MSNSLSKFGVAWILALATLALAGCATMGASTRALEMNPMVLTYERVCGEAEAVDVRGSPDGDEEPIDELVLADKDAAHFGLE